MASTENTPSPVRVDDNQITVLCVDDDPEYLALIQTAFDDQPDLNVLLETDPAQVPKRLGGVDCIVCSDRVTDTDGLALLDTVRELSPDLPFILHTSTPFEDVGEQLLGTNWTDYLEKAWSEPRMSLLAKRIRHLVVKQRLQSAAHRSYAALETSREATLIVAADGTVAFVNSRIISELSGDRSDIEGQPWSELFTGDSVERLRSEGIPTATDGWDWTGLTTLHTQTGEADSARTSVSSLSDGSLVFVFHELDRSSSNPA